MRFKSETFSGTTILSGAIVAEAYKFSDVQIINSIFSISQRIWHYFDHVLKIVGLSASGVVFRFI